MDEQKKNRLAAAITVNVILLIVILAAVLVYQIVAIAMVNAKHAQLVSEIEEYNQKIEQSEDALDYLKSEQYLLDLAFQLGYRFPKN